MALQFDGADVVMGKPPNNPMSSDQEAIFGRAGHSVNLEGKYRLFFSDNVDESISEVRAAAKPYTPTPYDNGNCAILAICRLSMQPEVYDSTDQIARDLPRKGRQPGRTNNVSPRVVTGALRWQV